MSPLYKRFRRESGALMDGDAPEGRKFSFDAENRQPWKGTRHCCATLWRTEVDLEVEALVEEVFTEHPGQVDLGALPTTRAQRSKRSGSWGQSLVLSGPSRTPCPPRAGASSTAAWRRR